MSSVVIQKQIHGYKQGHQLLSASISLGERDQDAVDRLSDLAGPLRPGESFDPYLTAYPLPSEEYYVVARTFQDPGARRSGCVRTSSALIPMAGWERIKGLDSVLAELIFPDRNGIAVEREIPIRKQRQPKPVTDGRMMQLIDAVFLDRRPVVFFDCAESEATAVRLMLALWPAVRRRFSLCTFVLGPRRLESRFFDLVFAPMSARSRFVGLGHRSVGGSTWLRHERDGGDYIWAEPAMLRIFHSDDPSLLEWDRLGVLRAEESGDRTALRIVLLWNELASRAMHNPTAVLGMLDILRSRFGKPDDALWADLEATMLRAIGATVRGSAVEEAWEFVFALEGKTGGGWASATVRERMEEGARRLAGRDAVAAVAAVAADPLQRVRSMYVLKGLADGVAGSPEFARLVEDVGRLPAVVVAKLMKASPHFVRSVVESVNVDEERWMEIFSGAFVAADEVGRRKIRQSTLEVAGDRIVEGLVPRVLAHTMGEELAELAVRTIESGVATAPALTRAIWDAARVAGGESIVRGAVLESANDAGAEQFLLRTLVLNERDIGWLAGRVRDKSLASRLLRGLVGTGGDEKIKALSPSAAREVVALLGTDVEACKQEIVRVLVLDVDRGKVALDVGFRTLSILRYGEARTELGEWMVRATLSDAQPEDKRVGEVLAEFGSRLAGLDLVKAATSRRVSTTRVGANMVALDACPRDVRNRVVEEMEPLSERLVGRRQEDLGREAYGAWASMIRDFVRENGTNVRLRVARAVLRFALRLERKAVSALIVETFPVAYRSLPKPEKHRRIGGFGSLLSSDYLWRMGFDEWEDGRRLAIRELVRAFMDSTWPPADLVVTALKAGVEKKVVKQIRERDQGGRYIDGIGRDAQRLGKSMRIRVLKAVEGH